MTPTLRLKKSEILRLAESLCRDLADRFQVTSSVRGVGIQKPLAIDTVGAKGVLPPGLWCPATRASHCRAPGSSWGGSNSALLASYPSSPPWAQLSQYHRTYTGVASSYARKSQAEGGESLGFQEDSLQRDHDDIQARLTPRAVVEQLNRHIVGQVEAKKAVAVAFRNRWRRHRVPHEARDDIVPKNILMIGPTGCGKTEIARRLAKLANSPFVKVEATKFTEVGYHGRDVDQIIRDLVENAIVLVKQRLRERAAAAIEKQVEEKILAALQLNGEELEEYRAKYRNGELEHLQVDVEMPQAPGEMPTSVFVAGGGNMVNIDLGKYFQNFRPKDSRRVSIAEARPLMMESEIERLFPQEVVVTEAIRVAEQDGIVFIDEIDKIVQGRPHGLDPSTEGVQRDLLPILEGSVINTKHGNVKTDHMLFICSGAFHSCKPSDMLAELQGRLPIRVELKGLNKDDFLRILTEPECNMIKQQQMLLSTEGVQLHFTDAAVAEIAALAEEINRRVENIGARRLHTVLERIVEDISFSAPERAAAAMKEGHDLCTYVIDKEHVMERVRPLLTRYDLSKYII